MGGEWKTARLGDLVDSSLGKMLDAQKNKGTPRPYLGNSNVRWGSFDLQNLSLMRFENDEEARYGIRDGDLIVCEGGEPGRCAIWREQIPGMKIQKALHRVRPKDGLNNYYLFYWFMLAGRTGRLEPFFTGTTIKHLTGRALNELEVPVPPIEEQRAIAHILGTLDDKIELNRRRNQTLEAMARALFKDWFVDFGPVRARMEAREPYLPADVWQLFPGRLDDEGKPVGWKKGTLGDVAEHPRRTIQPDKINPDTPYIALEHMPKRCIALNDWGIANALESNKYEFKQEEILFGKLRPYFHKVGVAPVDGVCSTDIVVITAEEKWHGFVLCHVSSDEFVEYTNAGSTGTKMPRTSWSEMARYGLSIPPGALAEAFNEHTKRWMSQIIGGTHESRTLAQLRDTLLPKLISGELRIADAEKFMERVA